MTWELGRDSLPIGPPKLSRDPDSIDLCGI